MSQLIANCILIGHSLTADLQALQLSHPLHLLRDTAYFPLLCPHRPRSLKALMLERLGVDFQNGEHDSVEDARAVLALYKSVQQEWEASDLLPADTIVQKNTQAWEWREKTQLSATMRVLFG